MSQRRYLTRLPFYHLLLSGSLLQPCGGHALTNATLRGKLAVFLLYIFRQCPVYLVAQANSHVSQFFVDLEAYKDTLFQLTIRQRDLLVAIGSEGKASRITSMQFVKCHHLLSASSVQKATQILEDKQLITHQQGVYEVYDKFLAEWLRLD